MESAKADPGRAAVPEPLLPAACKVRKVVQETRDTCTLELAPPGGAPLPFLPGQFNMLYAFGVGEVPVSISGDPARPDVLVHTIRDVGAVTRALCRANLGSVVGARGPYGSAWPVEHAQGGDVIFVAGGIGLAPLRPAILAVLARRAAYGRVAILVGARSPADLLYPGELEAWRRHAQVRTTVDIAGRGWSGRIGVVTQLVRDVWFEPGETHAFVCGPEVMMRFAVEALLLRGVEPGGIHVSMERNMKCGVGFCGHCQLGPEFVCTTGPVYPYPRLQRAWSIREL